MLSQRKDPSRQPVARERNQERLNGKAFTVSLHFETWEEICPVSGKGEQVETICPKSQVHETMCSAKGKLKAVWFVRGTER